MNSRNKISPNPEVRRILLWSVGKVIIPNMHINIVSTCSSNIFRKYNNVLIIYFIDIFVLKIDL